jgi:hypothetical protein
VGHVLGDLLPLGLGIAISPMPVSAVIVLLLSERRQLTSIGFLLGWIAGVGLLTALWTWLSGLLPRTRFDRSEPLFAAIEIVLGLVLLVVSIRQWTASVPEGAPAVPRWVAAIETIKPWEGLGIGAVYAAFRPKNLVLATAAGLVISSGRISFAESVVALAVFTAVASATLALPIIAWFAQVKGIRKLLGRLRERLVTSMHVITGTALLLLGVVLIGMGIAQL